MKVQRHYRQPVGYTLTKAMEAVQTVKPNSWKHSKQVVERPQLGVRKSKKPVTLAKHA